MSDRSTPKASDTGHGAFEPAPPEPYVTPERGGITERARARMVPHYQYARAVARKASPRADAMTDAQLDVDPFVEWVACLFGDFVRKHRDEAQPGEQRSEAVQPEAPMDEDVPTFESTVLFAREHADDPDWMREAFQIAWRGGFAAGAGVPRAAEVETTSQGNRKAMNEVKPGDATLRHAVAWMRATFPDDRHAQGWAAELDHVFLGGPPRPTPEGFNLLVSWDEFDRVRRERDAARAEVLRFVSGGVAMPTAIEEMDRWKKRANDADAAVYDLNCRVAELKNAISRALRSAEDVGILGADAFAILQGVVHDGIPVPPPIAQPPEPVVTSIFDFALEGWKPGDPIGQRRESPTPVTAGKLTPEEGAAFIAACEASEQMSKGGTNMRATGEKPDPVGPLGMAGERSDEDKGDPLIKRAPVAGLGRKPKDADASATADRSTDEACKARTAHMGPCACTDTGICFACLSTKGQDRAISEWAVKKGPR